MILQSPNHLVCPQEALGAHGAGGGPGAQEDMPGSAQGEDSGEGSAEYYSSYGGDFEKVTKGINSWNSLMQVRWGGYFGPSGRPGPANHDGSGTWHLAPGTCRLALGTWHLLLGT